MTENRTLPTRVQVLDFLLDDESRATLTPDDRVGIFSDILLGSSDLTKELLDQLIADYSANLVVVEGDHLEQNAELEDSNDLMDKGRAELAKELLKPTRKDNMKEEVPDYFRMAAGFYQCNDLPDDYLQMEENAFCALLEQNAWEPFVDWLGSNIQDEIVSLSAMMEKIARDAYARGYEEADTKQKKG